MLSTEAQAVAILDKIVLTVQAAYFIFIAVSNKKDCNGIIAN